MASKKRVPIGTVRPVVTVGGINTPGPGRSAPQRVINVPYPGAVYIGSDDPIIDVVARLIGKPDCTPPRPRYQTDERHGRTSALRYAGQDLRVQTIPIKFDAHGASVEPDIRALESLAEPVKSTGEPPLVRILGPALRHQGLKWRVTAIDEDKDRARHGEGGDPQILYVATVTLTQHVRNEVLILDGKSAEGLRNRKTSVRKGETSFYDVAKRVYGERSRAKDIVRANPGMRLGQKLKAGDDLRLP